MPLAVAAAAVAMVVAAIVVITERGRNTATIAAVNAAADPYASSLPISNLQLAQSSNMAGNQLLYLDGHIANRGNRIVSGIAIQVLFRNSAQEVAQNEPLQQLKIIRTRDPYVDLEPLSAAPLKPGEERDFRLIFDHVTPDWDGAYPQLRMVRVQAH